MNSINKYKTLTTDNLILQISHGSYTPLVLNFLESGRSVFEQYEAAKSPFFYTYQFQEHILNSEYDAAMKRQYLRYYIFEKNNPDKIIGTVSFGNVLPDPYISCNIGYKISPGYTSRGYCTDAVNISLNAAYEYLNIHRINAFVQENNTASIKVLEKCGFSLEGKCIKNLRVNGKWTDHLLYGLINPYFSS